MIRRGFCGLGVCGRGIGHNAGLGVLDPESLNPAASNHESLGNGPFTVAFEVYDNFFGYSSGATASGGVTSSGEFLARLVPLGDLYRSQLKLKANALKSQTF